MNNFEQELRDAINGKLSRDDINDLLDRLHQHELDGKILTHTVDKLWEKLTEKILDSSR